MGNTNFTAGVRFDAQGLVAAIVQDAASQRVLMLAYMNAETLQQTIDTGIATFWSRSRSEVWVKGATSGSTQHVVDIQLDCDGDALLLLVHAAGPACHNGTESCFDTAKFGGFSA
ncbi:MAG: phosphoribosyl-AMP cyclohydrolase [Micrococcales bacterium]